MALTEKNVMIVGGSSGIGFAVARAALAEGARVILVGRSPERSGRALSLLEAGERARAVSADVTLEPDVERLFQSVGDVDHVMSTAVELCYQPISTIDIAAARRLMDSKLFSALLLAKHGANHVRSGGSFTFTSGIAAERPMVKGALVAAANGALASFVRAAAIELAPLRVNALSPGWVDTAVWDAIAGEGKAALLSAMAERLPVRRIGSPEDIAHAALFLMTNRFTTGSVLHVEGGHTLV